MTVDAGNVGAVVGVLLDPAPIDQSDEGPAQIALALAGEDERLHDHPPRLQILESEYPDRLMQWVSNLLARDDLHLVAVSPAAVCALRESDSTNNPLLMPHYTVTVVYQERITSAACEPVDPMQAAA
jgi:hypothetical protein